MATQLDICNSALIKLGAEVIDQTMLTNSSNKRAKLLATQYEKVKKRLLRSHPWKFAVKRATISENGNTPTFGYTYEFDLPADFLKLHSAGDVDDAYVLTEDVIVENGKLLAFDEDINILYIADVDEDVFDDSFAEALAYDLAMDICYALVQSAEYKSQLRDEHKEALRVARSMNAQQGRPQSLQANDWLNVRY